MAARCHQSSRPRLSPAYFLAGSSTSMSCTESSGSTAHAELAGPLHAAKHVVLRAPAGSREPSPSRSTASSGRRRCAAAASSGKAAAPEPSGGSSASAACPAAAQRCRSRRLTEPLRQLAPRYRRPPPTLGHCRGRAERRARRCGAGSGFYSASGTISPIYGRSSRLLNNIFALGITPGLALAR
jgi:hypothetical protein